VEIIPVAFRKNAFMPSKVEDIAEKSS